MDSDTGRCELLILSVDSSFVRATPTGSRRQAQPGNAAGRLGPILQGEGAGVAFGDLPAQYEADARSSRLGREERDEKIGRSGKARAVVGHPDLDHGAIAAPARPNRAVRGQRRVGRVAKEVDQRLLDLVRVALDGDGRARLHLNRDARFEAGRAAYALGDAQRLWLRTRQLRQARIRTDETAEALRARRDDVQPSPHVVPPVVRQGIAREDALQTAGTSVWATVTKAAVVAQNPTFREHRTIGRHRAASTSAK